MGNGHTPTYSYAAQDPVTDFGLRSERRCRSCGCTDESPCMTVMGPCAWSTGDAGVCTACEGRPFT